jgi:hypothetical protein
MGIPDALPDVKELFPLHEAVYGAEDWSEPASYTPVVEHSSLVEHEEIFKPIQQLHSLALQISAAIDHEIGACG